MALILTLRKGHDFYVGGRRIVVGRIYSGVNFAVKNDEDKVFNVGEDEWTEVYPGVALQAAIPRDQFSPAVRVAIEAPEEKKILRGEVYRATKRPTCDSCKGKGVLTQMVLHNACDGRGCGKCNKGYLSDVFVCPDCGGVR